jgi:outer membrane protein OmpA-like peptidoglycan-associated protein
MKCGELKMATAEGRTAYMNRYWIGVVLTISVAGNVGCARKSYVRNQVVPIIEKVNRLDDETAKNTNEIKGVDGRSEQGVQALMARTDQVASQADTAGQQAAKAQQTADNASRQVAALSGAVSNLDKYSVVNQVSVHFALDRDTLTTEATKTLDELASQLSNTRNYIITVEGGTDSAGGKEYNYLLSDRRADTVMHYLAAKYNVPAFKIHVVGLGEDKPVAPNNTADGRAQNRRADVQMLSGAGETSPQSNHSAPGTASGAERGPK